MKTLATLLLICASTPAFAAPILSGDCAKEAAEAAAIVADSSLSEVDFSIVDKQRPDRYDVSLNRADMLQRRAYAVKYVVTVNPQSCAVWDLAGGR